MDYSKWLVKVAKLKDPKFYEGERKRAIDSILYDAKNHYAVATNSHVLLRVKDRTINEIHAYEPKTDVTSVGKNMPDYPMYDRLFETLESESRTGFATFGTKIVKTKLKPIKEYKKAVKAKNLDDKSGFDFLPDMVKLDWSTDKIKVMAHYEKLVEEPVLFEINLPTNKRPDVSFTSHFNPDYVVLLLEFIADVQRADSSATFGIYQGGELKPLMISNGKSMLVITPMRTI